MALETAIYPRLFWMRFLANAGELRKSLRMLDALDRGLSEYAFNSGGQAWYKPNLPFAPRGSFGQFAGFCGLPAAGKDRQVL